MSGSLAGVLIIMGLIMWVIGLWFAVLCFRYLTAARRAFDRYLDMTDDPIGNVAPMPPLAPGGGRSTSPPRHRSGSTSWGKP